MSDAATPTDSAEPADVADPATATDDPGAEAQGATGGTVTDERDVADDEHDVDAGAAVAGEYATYLPVQVVSLVFDLPSPSPVIHLREDDPPFRGIDFPIGLPEAQSIALAIEGGRPPRPSAHDLLAAVLVAAGCDLVAVRLTGVRGGTIHAELDVVGPRGREVLDCRPTDGIAVALRMPVPAPILADLTLLA